MSFAINQKNSQNLDIIKSSNFKAKSVDPKKRNGTSFKTKVSGAFSGTNRAVRRFTNGSNSRRHASYIQVSALKQARDMEAFRVKLLRDEVQRLRDERNRLTAENWGLQKLNGELDVDNERLRAAIGAYRLEYETN